MTSMVCLRNVVAFGITSSILKLRGFPFYLILGDLYCLCLTLELSFSASETFSPYFECQKVIQNLRVTILII